MTLRGKTPKQDTLAGLESKKSVNCGIYDLPLPREFLQPHPTIARMLFLQGK